MAQSEAVGKPPSPRITGPARPQAWQWQGQHTLQAWGLALPQGLGAKESRRQDEVEEEETEPSPGVQSPQHGENHLLHRP